MASLDEIEGTTVELILFLLAIALFWFLGGFTFLQGLLTGDQSEISGAWQSFQDIAQGMPSGSDPGTIPGAQQAQGLIESLRNIWSYIFGSDDSSDYNSDQTLSVEDFDNAYQIQPEQLQLATLNAIPDTESWIQQVESNPGSLPMF